MATVFDSYDYREALRSQIKVLKSRGKPMTWRKIADKIPLQYTFLSKCLNDSATHLSEDHLFRVCELLDLLPEETEFVLLLRARAVSRQPTRQEFLTRQIERVRKQKVVRAEHRAADPAGALSEEIEYLLDPMSSLVRTALFIKELQDNPVRLSSLLGVSPRRLKMILEKLEKLEFIELNDKSDKVLAFNRKPQHWGRQHPLMRAHQMGMKHHLLDRLRSTEEEDKESFFVTFTMDQEGFAEVKRLLQEVLKNVQVVIEKRKPQHMFQLSLDFLKVF